MAIEKAHQGARYITPALFLAPFMLLYLGFFASPLIYSLWLSLFVEKRIGGTSFVWLANYARAGTDPALWNGVGRVVAYSLIQVPLTQFVALVLALLLDSAFARFKPIFQLAFFLPFAIPGVVAALLWGYMYGNNFGVLTQLATGIGLPNPRFLSPERILPSLINITVWATTGANMIILYASLRGIPTDLYEAARLDGASEWDIIRKIKVPLLRSTLAFTTLLGIIGALQLFNEPAILQTLAPGAVTSSYTPNLYAYSLVAEQQRYNVAAAVAFTLAASIILVTGTILYFARRGTK